MTETLDRHTIRSRDKGEQPLPLGLIEGVTDLPEPSSLLARGSKTIVVESCSLESLEAELPAPTDQ